MRVDDKIILNTSDGAAKFVNNVSGWVDCHGRFFGIDERAARWSGATHIECSDCATPIKKQGWTICVDCQEKKSKEKYMALERKPWDGETPLYMDGTDIYFFSRDDLDDYIEENECAINDLNLILCKPVEMPQLDDDYFIESLHEDAEIPSELAEAILTLNKVVESLLTQTWCPDKYAAEVLEG
jgi:hypothetical protein